MIVLFCFNQFNFHYICLALIALYSEWVFMNLITFSQCISLNKPHHINNLTLILNH